MAKSTSLRLRFGTMSGVKTWNFKNIKTSVTDSEVMALAQDMIDNGSIYKYPPLVYQDATIVSVEEILIDIES